MSMGQCRAGDRTYVIRLARPEDLPQVVALDVEITGIEKPEYWNDIFSRYSCSGDENNPRASKTRLNRFFLCAADGDKVLGFIIGEIRAWEFGSPPCGWVFAIGVDHEARGMRVAETLFQAVCERFRKAGVTKVRTMLARDDTLVMSFFRSQGLMAGPFIQLETDLAP
jgi:ribosomal protein S18 acetylase RimI-like enzyme